MLISISLSVERAEKTTLFLNLVEHEKEALISIFLSVELA